MAMPKKPGRPKKKAADRKTVDLRIPVTPREKELIYAALAGDEFARWARDVLLRSARELGGGTEEDGEPRTGTDSKRIGPRGFHRGGWMIGDGGSMMASRWAGAVPARRHGHASLSAVLRFGARFRLGGAAEQLRDAATCIDPAQLDQMRNVLTRRQSRSLKCFPALLDEFFGGQDLAHEFKFGRKTPKMQAGSRIAARPSFIKSKHCPN